MDLSFGGLYRDFRFRLFPLLLLLLPVLLLLLLVLILLTLVARSAIKDRTSGLDKVLLPMEGVAATRALGWSSSALLWASWASSCS